MQSVLSWITAALAASRTSKPSPSPILSFFVFGDSYTDIGFRSTSPYPTLAQPFGYPPLGTNKSQSYLDGPLISANTSAKGPAWPQYLTTRYNATPTLTYDFAVGGANIPDSLSDQVQRVYQPRFSALYSADRPNAPRPGGATTWNGATALFAVWIGINDVNDCGVIFHPRRNVSMRACLAPRLEATLPRLLAELYGTGARRFVLVNLPPLERTPLVRAVGGEGVADYRDGVRLVNEVFLPEVVGGLEGRFGDVEVVVYDAFTLFEKVLDRPERYGFTDDECVVDGEGNEGKECVWADWFHPSTKFHELMARDFQDLLTGGENQIDL